MLVDSDEPDGFLITAFFTSRPDKIERNGLVADILALPATNEDGKLVGVTVLHASRKMAVDKA